MTGLRGLGASPASLKVGQAASITRLILISGTNFSLDISKVHEQCSIFFCHTVVLAKIKLSDFGILCFDCRHWRKIFRIFFWICSFFPACIAKRKAFKTNFFLSELRYWKATGSAVLQFLLCLHSGGVLPKLITQPHHQLFLEEARCAYSSQMTWRNEDNLTRTTGQKPCCEWKFWYRRSIDEAVTSKTSSNCENSAPNFLKGKVTDNCMTVTYLIDWIAMKK